MTCSRCDAKEGEQHERFCQFYDPVPAPVRQLLKTMNNPAPESTSALDRQVSGSHYKDLKIQPIEFIHANGLPFIEGCVIKYVTRWRAKGGVKDLEKAKHFIDLLIELETRTTKD